MTEQELPPVIMAFAGVDSTGGAGIQADIESLASIGCHAVPVVTAITIQDTQNIKSYAAVEDNLVIEQARMVLPPLRSACLAVWKTSKRYIAY